MAFLAFILYGSLSVFSPHVECLNIIQLFGCFICDHYNLKFRLLQPVKHKSTPGGQVSTFQVTHFMHLASLMLCCVQSLFWCLLIHAHYISGSPQNTTFLSPLLFPFLSITLKVLPFNHQEPVVFFCFFCKIIMQQFFVVF